MRRPQQHMCVFLEWDTYGPDIVSWLLRRSGDVEVNPGPRSGMKCGNCEAEFSQQSRQVQCGECKKWFCKTAKPGRKQTCAGYTRWKQTQMLEASTPLKCSTCRGLPDGQEREEGEERDDRVADPGRCIAPNCSTKAKIKKGAPFLTCSRCQGHYHVQLKCSEMTRAQRGKLDESRWVCPICIEKEAEQTRQEVGEERESEYRQTKAKERTIKILQLNIDSFLSKFDELKEFIRKHDIDVFVLQETKMVKKDKLPTIPGYAMERLDRSQPKGKKKNRGGGLITGVSERLAKKRLVKFSIRGRDDNLTEWLTIEIPTKNKEKIRVTNVYVPPANAEASRSVSRQSRGSSRGRRRSRGVQSRGRVVRGTIRGRGEVEEEYKVEVEQQEERHGEEEEVEEERKAEVQQQVRGHFIQIHSTLEDGQPKSTISSWETPMRTHFYGMITGTRRRMTEVPYWKTGVWRTTCLLLTMAERLVEAGKQKARTPHQTKHLCTLAEWTGSHGR